MAGASQNDTMRDKLLATSKRSSVSSAVRTRPNHGIHQKYRPYRQLCLGYGHVWSGRFTTIGVEVLLTTTQ